MLTNLFSDLSPRPDDPILGVARAFGEDPRADKVNLSVGVYLDDEGRIPLQPVVAEAEKRLLDSKAPHGYGPMEGLPKFCSAVKRLVFGDDPELLRASAPCRRWAARGRSNWVRPSRRRTST